MTNLERTIARAARARVAILTAELARLRDAERLAIAQTALQGASLPEHYWQARHRVEARLAAAQGLLAAFEGDAVP